MKAVKIAELKDRLSEHLRRVEAGSEVVVTDRGRPIARIVPFAPARALTVTEPSVAFTVVRGRTWKPCNLRVSSTELLAEERGER